VELEDAAGQKLESYYLGSTQVEVYEDTTQDGKLLMHCSDEEYEITFRISKDEFNSYRKLTNKRVQQEFRNMKKEQAG
jgi:hypothetical protein